MGVTLCDDTDIAARLGRSLTAAEIAAWPGKAKEASVLIEGFLDRSWDALDDVPENVRVVASRMVRRVFSTVGTGSAPGGLPANTRSFNASMGPLGHSTTFAADVEYGDVWLSRADRLILNKPSNVVHHEPMFSTTTTLDGDWGS